MRGGEPKEDVMELVRLESETQMREEIDELRGMIATLVNPPTTDPRPACIRWRLT